jgi:hypothetical protein
MALATTGMPACIASMTRPLIPEPLRIAMASTSPEASRSSKRSWNGSISTPGSAASARTSGAGRLPPITSVVPGRRRRRSGRTSRARKVAASTFIGESSAP